MSSISQLIRTSWETFNKSVLNLFLLNILGLVIDLIFILAVTLVFIVSGAGSFILKNGLEGALNELSKLPPSALITSGLILTIIFLGLIIIHSALQIASIFIVNNPTSANLRVSIKQSFPLIIPLFLVSILTSLLTIGGFFVFILPGFLFMFLLIFTQYEVILNGKRGLQALKRSVLIVSKNFGAILIRLLLLGLIYVLVAWIVPSVLEAIAGDVGWIVSIFSFFVNLLLGWFVLAYQITLYKEASAGLEKEAGKGILWMWLVSILGLLIAAGIFYGSWKVISSGLLKNLPQMNQKESVEKDLEGVNQIIIDNGQNSSIKNVIEYTQ